jgi:hypothetical protein
MFIHSRAGLASGEKIPRHSSNKSEADAIKVNLIFVQLAQRVIIVTNMCIFL